MTQKDSERRAIVLREFYDKRYDTDWVSVPGKKNITEDERIITTGICRQLADHDLIEWKPASALEDTRGPRFGMGRITAHGVDVIEGNTRAAIAIDQSQHITVQHSENVQVGNGNAQGISINGEKVMAAINASRASVEEKQAAKSLLKSIFEIPLFTKALNIFAG